MLPNLNRPPKRDPTKFCVECRLDDLLLNFVLGECPARRWEEHQHFVGNCVGMHNGVSAICLDLRHLPVMFDSRRHHKTQTICFAAS